MIRLTFLFLFVLNFAQAQTRLSGKVLNAATKEILDGVNIRNLTGRNFARSSIDGNYEIVAKAGDRVIFSSAGFHTDTLTVTDNLFGADYDIFLKPNIVRLEEIEVDQLSKYVEDSIRRREDYAYLFNGKRPAKLANQKGAGDAPGFSASPISFYSKGEKDKRKLLKRIQEEDETEYIEAKFSRLRVAYLTKMHGDTLRVFMNRYKPSYAYCRAASNGDMLLYINDHFIEFKENNYK